VEIIRCNEVLSYWTLVNNEGHSRKIEVKKSKIDYSCTGIKEVGEMRMAELQT